MFCGVLPADNEVIRDNSFVSRVRSYLGKYVDFEEFQHKIIENWKDEIPDKNILLADATCYEVYIRFPTDSERRCGQTSLGFFQTIISDKNDLEFR